MAAPGSVPGAAVLFVSIDTMFDKHPHQTLCVSGIPIVGFLWQYVHTLRKHRREQTEMIQNSMYPAVESAYPVFNPMFKEFSNERLYEALCAATAPLDAGLEELPASP